MVNSEKILFLCKSISTILEDCYCESPSVSFSPNQNHLTFFSLTSHILQFAIVSCFAFNFPQLVLVFLQINCPKLDTIAAELWSMLESEAGLLNTSLLKCSCWYNLFLSPNSAILILHTQPQPAWQSKGHRHPESSSDRLEKDVIPVMLMWTIPLRDISKAELSLSKNQAEYELHSI